MINFLISLNFSFSCGPLQKQCSTGKSPGPCSPETHSWNCASSVGQLLDLGGSHPSLLAFPMGMRAPNGCGGFRMTMEQHLAPRWRSRALVSAGAEVASSTGGACSLLSATSSLVRGDFPQRSHAGANGREHAI